jgi:hypothetical protein
MNDAKGERERTWWEANPAQLQRGPRVRERASPPPTWCLNVDLLFALYVFGWHASGAVNLAETRRRPRPNAFAACPHAGAGARPFRAGPSVDRAHSQHGSPRRPSRPSFTRKTVIPSAATGSAHHQPKRAFSPIPVRVISESHQHAVV